MTINGTKIIEDMARTLWLMAYAEAADHADYLDDEDDGYGNMWDPEDWERPLPGGEWDDVVPDTPDNVYADTRSLIQGIYQANALAWGYDTPERMLEAMCLAWMDEADKPGCDADRFAHCLAMQCLGAGVGLDDDLPVRSKLADRIITPFTCEGYTTCPDGTDYVLTWRFA